MSDSNRTCGWQEPCCPWFTGKQKTHNIYECVRPNPNKKKCLMYRYMISIFGEKNKNGTMVLDIMQNEYLRNHGK